MTQSGQTRWNFVGHQRELANLKATLDAAVAGQGLLVMLAGAPGIVKTRAAQELALYAESDDAQVRLGWCHQQQGSPPFWSWIQPIRSYIQQTDAESLDIQMGRGQGTYLKSSPRFVKYCPTSSRFHCPISNTRVFAYLIQPQ